MLSGMKCLVSGGIRLKDYPGRWWGSRQPMDANFDQSMNNEWLTTQEDHLIRYKFDSWMSPSCQMSFYLDCSNTAIASSIIWRSTNPRG